jgi:hypothetical protein
MIDCVNPLDTKDRADLPGWWIAEGDSNQPGSALGDAMTPEITSEPAPIPR